MQPRLFCARAHAPASKIIFRAGLCESLSGSLFGASRRRTGAVRRSWGADIPRTNADTKSSLRVGRFRWWRSSAV